MSFVSWRVACKYHITLFVLSNRSCEWYDLLIKICVNMSPKSYIYISVRQLYTGNSHRVCMFAHNEPPLICKSYDFRCWLSDVVGGVVHFNSVNVVFEIDHSLYLWCAVCKTLYLVSPQMGKKGIYKCFRCVYHDLRLRSSRLLVRQAIVCVYHVNQYTPCPPKLCAF